MDVPVGLDPHDRDLEATNNSENEQTENYEADIPVGALNETENDGSAVDSMETRPLLSSNDPTLQGHLEQICSRLHHLEGIENSRNDDENENEAQLRSENIKLRADVERLESRLDNIQRLFARVPQDNDTLPNDDSLDNSNDDTDGNSTMASKLRNLPSDTFSFIIIAHPFSPPFFLGVTVFLFQVVAFMLVALSVIDRSYLGIESDVSNNTFNIPVNVEPAVKVGQIIAIVIAVSIQDDIRTGLNLLHEGYDIETVKKPFPRLRYWKWMLSIVARIMEGGIGLFVTFLLIVTSDNVVDLLLNFTAMQFVSQLDEVCFFMAQEGFVGKPNKVASQAIIEKEYCTFKRGRSMLRNVLLLIIFVVLFIGWFFIARSQATGSYLCSTVFVQFDDDLVRLLGPFSGLYDRRSEGFRIFSARRIEYVDRQSGRAVFSYCNEGRYWTFTWETDGVIDPCNNWRARSPETYTYNLVGTASDEWIVRNYDSRQIPMNHFHLSCHDCDDTLDEEDACGGRGMCTDAVCSCDEGWYGLRCEFREPCSELHFDVRFGAFQSNHLWADTFHRFVVNGDPVDVYNRPVYVNEYSPGHFDIIFFVGRRWVATYSPLLPVVQEDSETAQEALARYFLEGFHPVYSNATLVLVSGPVDVGSPENSNTPVGVEWLSVGTHVTPTEDLRSFVLPPLHDQLSSVLLCGVCDDETNPCLYDGVCVEGTCQCAIGSLGSICQVPPVGNGHCDSFYNTLEFEYDGGDCCQSTCVSSREFPCGSEELGFVSTGYFFCHLPSMQWQLSGEPIDGLAGSLSGTSVQLSANGEILAVSDPSIGRVRLFDKDGSRWVQRGQAIEGPEEDFFGSTIAMSLGSLDMMRNPVVTPPIRLAVGMTLTDKAVVSVFDCPGGDCEQVGDDLVLYDTDRRMKSVFAMSGNGEVIAGGFSPEPDNDISSFDYSPLSIFEWNASGGWNRHDMDFLFEDMEFVHSLALSGSGNVLAVGSYESEFSNGVPVPTSDRRRVFAWNGTSWNQRGSAIISFSPHPGLAFDLQGGHIAFSDDGNVLAVGLYFDQSLLGGVDVFHWDDTESDWVRRGSLLRCENYILQGMSVDLSSDGLILAMTAADPSVNSMIPSLNVNGTVCTFNWNGAEWVELENRLQGGHASSVALSGDGSALAVGLPFHGMDLAGRTSVYVFPSECPAGTSMFRLSLTLDDRPESTTWEVFSNDTRETLLEGGPYGIMEFVTTHANEVCVPTDSCTIFSMYKSLDLRLDLPADGMRRPGGHAIFLDGQEVVRGQISGGAGRYFVGDCLTCPDGTELFQVLIQTCVAVAWQLVDNSGESVFANHNFLEYTRSREFDCTFSGQSTYWEDLCLPRDECFSFSLFMPQPSNSSLGPTLQYRLFWDEDETAEDFVYESTNVRVGAC